MMLFYQPILMNLCAKVVQVEINRKAFWMKVGETEENGAFSTGENPIVAQHFIFTTT